MVELEFLGGASLRGEGRENGIMAARRHPLALLALLATAEGQLLSRPRVIGLLWPDVDEATGRNRLTSTLYMLRKALGRAAIESVGDNLRLDRTAVGCDVWRFREALASGALEKAVEAYRGPFLEGFYLEGSSLFEERVEQERQRLDRSWRQAVEALAEKAEKGGRWREAADRWQELAAADSLDGFVARRLVTALAKGGSLRGALQAARRHKERLREELDASPDAELEALVGEIRQQLVAEHRAPPSATADHSIAVLPFETLAAEAQSAFAEGIHSGILNRLALLEGLSVIARTSVMRYREAGVPLAQVGEELGVKWVLEGAVQARQGQFRIDVRLAEAATARQVWAQQYAGTLTTESFFDTQADISRVIVSHLRDRLTTDERLLLAENPTQSLDAYRLCALGRMRLDQRSEEQMRRALDCFEQALELDPDYALARVGIADALGLLHAYGYASEEVLQTAAEAIGIALERDPDSAEAHAANGRLLGQRKALRESTSELKLAVALKPGYAEAHNWLAVGFHIEGAIDEALASAHRAVALNPLSPEAVANLASSQLFAGDLDKALRESRRALELEPTYHTATFFEALSLYEKGCFAEAATRVEGVDLPWAGSGVVTTRALALIAAGEKRKAAQMLRRIRTAGHPFDEGIVLAALGNTAEAFEAFDRERFDGVDFATGYWPTVAFRYLFRRVWKSLEGERGFDELAERIDLSWGLARRRTRSNPFRMPNTG